MTSGNNVDVKFLAVFFRVDERTIQLWSKDWELKYNYKKMIKGQYDFVKCVDCRIRDLEQDVEEAKKGDATKYELEKILLKERIENIQLQNSKDKNEVVEIEFVKQAWNNEVRTFIKSLQALPARLSTRLEGKTSYQDRFTLIQEELNDIRTELSKMNIIEDEKQTEQLLSNIEVELNKEPEQLIINNA
jgi:phage terminase Nu1 subunit (DNA packaging protein)